MWPAADELLTAWRRLVADPLTAGPSAALVVGPPEADLGRSFPATPAGDVTTAVHDTVLAVLNRPPAARSSAPPRSPTRTGPCGPTDRGPPNRSPAWLTSWSPWSVSVLGEMELRIVIDMPTRQGWVCVRGAVVEPTRGEVDRMPGPVVLEFGAGWCPHCQAIQPAMADLRVRHPGVRQIRVEDGKGRPLGRSFRVKVWPTLVFLQDGREVSRLVRPPSEEIAKGFAELGG